MDKHTFENWDEQNYTLDLSLYDNVDVLAEGLDIFLFLHEHKHKHKLNMN